MKRFIVIFTCLIISLIAQTTLTVDGTTVLGGQTAPFSIPLTWHSKLVATGTCPSPDLISGNTMTCTVTLSQTVPGGQTATVTLTSSDPTHITVPATVIIPGGSSSTTFVVTGL